MSNWSLIDQFARCLDRRAPQATGTWADPKRKLGQRQYLCLFLFTLFNPVLSSVRALCAASNLERVRAKMTGGKVSLGSFSEAQHLCDPALLEGLFRELSGKLGQAPPRDPNQAWERWLAQDSSVFAALPRMSWAVYGGGKAGHLNNAVRLHLSFNVLSDHPVDARVTPGKTCERKAWKSQWQKGAAYVGDRYYSGDYGLLRELDKSGGRYIVRLRDCAKLEIIEELDCSQTDIKAGVQRQAVVRLGEGPTRIAPVRVVWIRSPTAGELRLVTNLRADDAPAQMVSEIYRLRWQIEGFFRWVKCLLGCRHWLAESHNGVTLQLYLALIAAVLLQLHFGRRPNQRMLELIQLHQLGWASRKELMEQLEAEIQRQNSKKKNPGN